ncbi:MAG: sulfate adenylyltransferase subunit CysN [Trichlorobacter sp.]|uniref:sulfate adenylyltransferase subunit CysN n=1 Tax=Trichlorobacter sp. TaxID=2911007 RepID=UPI00256D94C9|nr:sulfate adenylyltransferase subunit CysN [Trichlorobacter sp.]MDK9717823.1 sulfate adenylyltransferase subunit CysN [Trichlorobacter sp.]
MSHQSEMIASDIHSYLKSQEVKGMLRFITCGSVDDGKSTLIGRLLWDSKLIFEDQLAALEADSKRIGTQGGEIDYALLLDGLQAEREQGITIDVAYRFFSTDKRKFIVADTPGHEQYTRNMVTGASTADVAVILVDARKGVLTQTRRHSFLVSLMGIRHVVLAINKMDLVEFSVSRFQAIREEYAAFAAGLGFADITVIPISALQGDNVLLRSGRTPWHDGPTLMEYLETVDAVHEIENQAFRMPVQWVNRPDLDFRGFCGTLASGRVQPGDEIVVAASGKTSRVARIVTMDGDLDEASTGQAVTLVLEDEIDISRGDLLADPLARPSFADQFEARVVWMYEDALMAGRRYLMKSGCSTVPAAVTALKYKINVNLLQHEPAKRLELNEVGVCNLVLDRPIAFDPYAENHTTGSFILIDRISNATVGAGMIDFALRRATNVHWHTEQVSRDIRAALKGQSPCVIWLTGLSGSGKSTIANALEQRLVQLGRHTMLLDGDNIRHGLNKDLGFTEEDRIENIRRIGEVARLLTEAGLIVITAFISPYRAEREMVRNLLPAGEFVEVYVSTSLEECERRDVKGLYKKARKGSIPNFTGISAPYEEPLSPDVTVDTSLVSADRAVAMILESIGLNR